MDITQHYTNNELIAAPPGVDISICRAAAITRFLDKDLGLCWQTFWRPQPEELKALNEGGLVMLTFASITVYPHRVEVTAEK